jgi:hypothetical protein
VTPLTAIQQMYGMPQTYGQYYPGYEYSGAGVAGQPAGATADPAQQAGWGAQDPAAAAYYQANQWGAYYGGQAQGER